MFHFSLFLIALFISCGYTQDTFFFSGEDRFVPDTDIVFNLYTRKNPKIPQILIVGNSTNFTSSNYQIDKPLELFVHGLTNVSSALDLVDAFMAAGDGNVIVVDWTKGTVAEEAVVINFAPLVGKFIAYFLDWLSSFGMIYKDVHLIGNSLGCHVVGWAGRSCLNGTVEMITACDPPKKFWENSSDRINPNDAKYVEVIHTNTGFHGLTLPTGTADFYPNGGATNPGCDNNTFCDHMRAFEYFVDSINHKKFAAQKCIDYEEMVAGKCSNLEASFMGGCVVKNITGVFYLSTNPNKPYYKGNIYYLRD